MKRTELVRRSELKRATPMRRTGFTSTLAAPLVRQAPIKQCANKPQRKPGVEVSKWIGEDIARKYVKGRSGGWCEIRMVGCFGRATDWHHRKNRSQGGLWQASNGLHACRWCHEHVTDTRGNRGLFEANGWIVPRRLVPAEVPVLAPTGVRVLLDDIGDYLPMCAA